MTLIKKTYRYKFTQKELKKKLGMKGNLSEGGLWEGRSPHQVEQGKKQDEDVYFIESEEELEKEDD